MPLPLSSPGRWVRNFAPVLLALSLAGCGSGGDQPLEGAVTLSGQPVESGTIQFYQTSDPPVVCAGAMIVKGRYEVPKDHGLKPGTYLVRITSPEAADSAKGTFDNPFPSGAREKIPAKYNTESKLTVEVRPGEKGRFDFNLD